MARPIRAIHNPAAVVPGLSTPAQNFFFLPRQALGRLSSASANPHALAWPYHPAMTEKNVEQLLNDQLATCLQAMQDCLNHARASDPEDGIGNRRRADIAYVARLMKASARLTEALGKLKGETSHNIHVTRQSVDKG